MPEATDPMDHMGEAMRLRAAYKKALEDLGHPAQWAHERGSQSDIWRAKVFAQRNCEALLSLANMHASLAVAAEIRAFRERYRLPGSFPGSMPKLP